jgi:hypothetical protein
MTMWMKMTMLGALACWAGLTACGSDASPTLLEKDGLELQVGGCGAEGDQDPLTLLGDGHHPACSEVLFWRYDAPAQVLEVLHRAVDGACCQTGEIQVLQEDDGGLEMRNHLFGEMCRCMCAYDFSARIPGVPPGHLPFRLLFGEQANASGLVWEGVLDLDACEGAIVIRDHSNEDDLLGFCEDWFGP